MTNKCSIPGCDREVHARQWCGLHYDRWLHRGDPMTVLLGQRGNGTKDSNGYCHVRINNKRRRMHVIIAEGVLRRPLKKGEEVHHADENKLNNSNDNLVICNRAYHQLLHMRQRSFDATGFYHWRKCRYCKQYDDPANLQIDSRNAVQHATCKRLEGKK